MMGWFSGENRGMKVQVLVCLLVWVIPFGVDAQCVCRFPGIFNFGDSNSDTGGFYAAFPPQSLPNGITYFGRPTGRSSDGRLYIDFLAEALGFPFLSPYLKSVGSNFTHGVNFAVAASPILRPNTSAARHDSPFNLDVQINQMKQFRDRVQQLGGGGGGGNLPAPDIFTKALYIIWIGQRDSTFGIGTLGQRFVPFQSQMAARIVNATRELYRLGGRTFLIMNLAPLGCFGAVVTQVPHNASDTDSAGCMISFNNIVRNYNSMLKQALDRARQEQDLSGANIIYTDNYSLISDLYHNPTSYGFEHGVRACCGYGGGRYNFRPGLFCGNDTITSACTNPQSYVNWDGVHLTDEANRILADGILSGSYFDPPFNIARN